MLDITHREAMKGLVDFNRIEEMLTRINGRIDHVALDRISPLSAPMFLEIGKVPIRGSADEALLDRYEDNALDEAGLS